MSTERTLDARTRQLQDRSSRLVLAQHCEPKDDIAAERQRATFDITPLSWVLNGGRDKLQKR